MNKLEIKMIGLSKAEYLVIMLNNNMGHVWEETYYHNFSSLLDILESEDTTLKENVDLLDVPVYGEIVIDEEHQIIPEISENWISKIIRIK